MIHTILDIARKGVLKKYYLENKSEECVLDSPQASLVIDSESYSQ